MSVRTRAGVSLVAVLMVVAGVQAAAAGADETATTIKPLAVTELAPVLQDDPDARTRFSRSAVRADGKTETFVSATPLNYRDGAGRWQRIDTSLVRRADGDLSAARNEFAVTVPSRAATDPVRVEAGSDAFEFSLLGGRPSRAEASGSQARFRDAITDVDLVYEAGVTSLKESIVLRSASAPTTFEFAMGLSAGLRVVERADGEVAVVDGRGEQRFGLAAPWMEDASGEVSTAVRYELVDRGGQQVLRVIADEAWIKSSDRTLPVTIDPTVYVGPQTNCEIVSGSEANVSRCSTSEIPVVVGRDSSARIHRALAKFDLSTLSSVLPSQSTVATAEVYGYYANRSGSTAVSLDAHALTRAFTPQATWNRYSTSSTWTAAGGDFATPREGTRSLDPSWVNGWVGIGLPRLIQGWIDGSSPNHGLVIKAQNETVARTDTLDHLGLKIVTQKNATGVADRYTYERQTLGNGDELAVNVGNGNLVVSATDHDSGDEIAPLADTRHFNTLDEAYQSYYTKGRNWRAGAGYKVFLSKYWVDGSYALEGPTGSHGFFYKQTDGTYKAVGLDATLVEQGNGRVHVTYPDGTLLDFDPGADQNYLGRKVEPGGYTTTYTYNSAGLYRATDNRGHQITHAYDSAGDLDTVTDENNRVWTYTHDSAHKLLTVKTPSNATTTYGYTGELLTSITTPDGERTELSQNSDGRTAYIRRKAQTGSPETTTFTYGTGTTTVTSPDGRQRTFTYDARLFVTQSSTSGGPGVTASGSLSATPTLSEAIVYELPVSVTSTANLADVAVSINDQVDWSDQPDCGAPCTSLSTTYRFDPREWDAGPATVRVSATDVNGRSSTRQFRIVNPGPGVGFVPEEPQPVDKGFDIGYSTGPEANEPDIQASTCATDPELGPDDFCPQTEDPRASSAGAPPAAPRTSLLPGGSGWGMAIDRNDAGTITKPAFAALGADRVRIAESFDAVRRGQLVGPRPTTPEAREYRRVYLALTRTLNAARRQGHQVLMSFDRARRPIECGATNADPNLTNCFAPDPDGNGPQLGDLFTAKDTYTQIPTKAEYLRGVRAFMRRYNWIRDFTPFNEPNDAGRPTSAERLHTAKEKRPNLSFPTPSEGPKAAARFWIYARSLCRSLGRTCRVAAGDFPDQETLTQLTEATPTKSYLRQYIEALNGRRVDYWAIHPYRQSFIDPGPNDLTNGRAAYVRFMQRTAAYDLPGQRSDVWITEIGARYGENFGQESSVRAQLARDLALPSADSRLTRFYYYKWSGGGSFNTGLIDLVPADPAFPSLNTVSYQGDTLRCSYFLYRARANPAASTPARPVGC